MCQPGKECEMPPEFVYLAFDGVNYEENGKRKVYSKDRKSTFGILLQCVCCSTVGLSNSKLHA